MFEGAFEKLGRTSAKHSGKVIIFWIALLLLLTPFASLLFTETSYDLGGSITPANSMANIASNLQTKYFGGNGSSGSNQSMVIVTTGTYVNQSNGFNAIVKSQNQATSYLKGQGIKANFTSIIDIENSTLTGVGLYSSAILNGTYPLVSSINQQAVLLNETVLAMNGTVFGFPALYYSIYSKEFYNLNQTQANASSVAYYSTLDNISKAGLGRNLTPIAYLYFNSFSKFINESISNTGGYISPANVSSSINSTVIDPTSGFLKLLQSNQTAPLYGVAYALDRNFTFQQSFSPGFNASFNRFNDIFVVSQISNGLSSNSTVSKFINTQLNLSITHFVNLSYKVGNPATAYQVRELSDKLVANSTINFFAGNPLISINKPQILQFVRDINSTNNPNLTVSTVLSQLDFSSFPAVPADYVYHQFVGYNNATVITILTTSANLTTSQVNQVGSIYGTNLKNIPNTSYYLAGSSALSNQLASESLAGMVRALVIGIVLSVIIVGVFFRSPVAAFLPLAVFGMSAAISISLNALLYKYVIHGSISFITPTLLLILLLGLSSDYVVYIMSRYRRELRKKNDDAAAITTRWAGHAVFTSGITVGISYVVLWLSNVPIFSDSGITNAIGVVIAVLIANTFLIAVMSRAKGKIFWPYNVDKNEHLPAEKSMQKIAHFVVNNKGKILVLFLVSALFGTYLYASTPTNMDVFKLVPSSSGIQAIQVVNSSFNGDFFDRGFIIMEFSSPVSSGHTYNWSEINAITTVEKKLLDSSQVSQVYGPTFPYGQYTNVSLPGVSANYISQYRSQISSYIGNDSKYVIIDFQLKSLAYESTASSFVKNLPQLIGNQSNGVTYSIYIGGLTESLNDSYSFTLSSFIKMVPILAIAIFIVLLIQISSLLTPIRLIFMVFASVIISLALAYIALHLYAGLPILIFLPMFTVITLLAVGLDYDIFMVSRVREEVYKGRSDEEGIKTSITENGGVIITLGTLLFATFGSLAFSGIGIIQEIGIGLAFGVLIDTFISWPFFVPSVMLYLHRFNWWPSKIGQNRDKAKK